MGKVRSSLLADGAPIDRRHLDTARKPFRILIGILFVGYSGIGTVFGVRDDLAPAFAGRDSAWLFGLIIGVAVAIAIFVAEAQLSDAARGWYLLVLVPDVWYTYHFSDWIGAIVNARMAPGAGADAVTIAITAVFSLAVAYFGERLIFGPRRRG